MDPVTFVGVVAATAGLVKLVAPLLGALVEALGLTRWFSRSVLRWMGVPTREVKDKLKVTVTSDDGTVREVKIDKSPLTEEQIKKVVDLLSYAADATKASPKK